MRILFTAPNEHLRHLEYPGITWGWQDGVYDAWVCDPLKPVTRPLLELTGVRYLATPSTGTNHIDLEACKDLNIKVFSLLDNREKLNCIKASSEFTFWLILSALRLGGFRQWKHYDRNDDFMRGNELYGKKVGLIGYGRIGKNVARYCQAFGAEWDYYDPAHKKYGNVKRMFKSDIVVICCSLTEETRGMIKDELDGFEGILVNTARAEIIDEAALLKWTEKGRYATDVLHGEVQGITDSPLLHRSNVIVTPHIAGTTYESQEKAARIVLDLLEEYERTV